MCTEYTEHVACRKTAATAHQPNPESVHPRPLTSTAGTLARPAGSAECGPMCTGHVWVGRRSVPFAGRPLGSRPRGAWLERRTCGVNMVRPPRAKPSRWTSRPHSPQSRQRSGRQSWRLAGCGVATLSLAQPSPPPTAGGPRRREGLLRAAAVEAHAPVAAGARGMGGRAPRTSSTE